MADGKIFGLDAITHPPESGRPVEAVALVKYIDEDGELCIHMTSTSGLTLWEKLGLYEAAAFTCKMDMHEGFQPEEPDTDGRDE